MSSQKYTIAEAHRATGKSESTIRLHLKDRKNPLSHTKDDSGKVLIDGAELIRRYPDNVTVDSLEAAKLKRGRAGQDSHSYPVPKSSSDKHTQLQHQLALLEQAVKYKDEMIDKLTEDLEKREREAERFTALLTDQRNDAKGFQEIMEQMAKTTRATAQQNRILIRERENHQSETPDKTKGLFSFFKSA